VAVVLRAVELVRATAVIPKSRPESCSPKPNQEVRAGLGAQAGEAKLTEVIGGVEFTNIRRAMLGSH
jgi:hypothetical protein